MRSLPRWIGSLTLVLALLAAACNINGSPTGAPDQPTDISHAAGEGYIGPAETHGNPGSTGSFPFGGGATGGSQTGTAAGGSTAAGAASPEPSPNAQPAPTP